MFLLSLDKTYKRNSGYSINPTEARSSHHNLSGSQPAHGSSHSLGIKVGNLLTFVSSKKGRSLSRTSPQHQHTWSMCISKMKVFWQQPVLALIKQNWKKFVQARVKQENTRLGGRPQFRTCTNPDVNFILWYKKRLHNMNATWVIDRSFCSYILIQNGTWRVQHKVTGTEITTWKWLYINIEICVVKC